MADIKNKMLKNGGKGDEKSYSTPFYRAIEGMGGGRCLREVLSTLGFHWKCHGSRVSKDNFVGPNAVRYFTREDQRKRNMFLTVVSYL